MKGSGIVEMRVTSLMDDHVRTIRLSSARRVRHVTVPPVPDFSHVDSIIAHLRWTPKQQQQHEEKCFISDVYCHLLRLGFSNMETFISFIAALKLKAHKEKV